MSIKEQWFKATHEPNAIQRFVARKWLFNLLQPLGVHVTADHFYEIVPNTRFVAEHHSGEARDLVGIDFRRAESEQRAMDWVKRHGPEFATTATRFGFFEAQTYFRGTDALLYYALLREHKPARVVEVGQGFSTRIALAALDRNAAETGVRPTIVSIDPFPRLSRQEIPSSVELELIEAPVQQVDPDTLLASCDLLFVDSSHVHKFGSDVAFEFTTLYPRLAPGTLLHVHDIFSPFDYPRAWIVDDHLFWNEQYLLECFLMFNARFEVYLPVHLLTSDSPRLAEAVSALPLDPAFQYSGGSFYLRRV